MEMARLLRLMRCSSSAPSRPTVWRSAARRHACLIAAAFLLASWPLPAIAQAPGTSAVAAAPETGGLAGIVTTVDEVPLERAQITIAGTSLRAVTQRNGQFHLPRLTLGIHSLEVRLLGYGRVVLPVEIEPGETLRLHVVMATEAVPLAPVEIRAERGHYVTPQMREFEARRARGAGKFFTQEDIRVMQPRVFTDILRRAPGLTILPMSSSHGGFSAQSTRAGGAIRPCPVIFYVNGSPLPIAQDVPINSFIVPEEVVGVEVYNASQIPPQYNVSLYGARCGVVLVWTRSGVDRSIRR
jgi:hypothetical protein